MLACLLVATTAAAPSWQTTLERVGQAVVSIRVTSTRDFDTDDAGVSQGTGFVVDTARGLILTNRHMVHPGPVVAEGVLHNDEEVQLHAVYRDPVHDFGFYRFDPSEVHHTKLVSLPLAPHAAKVGTEIRVIGNDAGEKNTILDGTLARRDRNAPSYASGYTDFNTFYLQAASNTSGGSSGSPVVDVRGRVLALNAGGNLGAASSFYLPLERVVRTLEYLQADQPVPRGTLQTVFVHKTFDELRRLGLTSELETSIRRRLSGRPQQGRGMLVVEKVLRDGPAYNRLQPGDILHRIQGQVVTDFIGLESHLDEAGGQSLSVEVLRGDEPLTLDVTVGDLHAITPDHFLEVGRGVLHPLSYQVARRHNLPVRGVYVALAGYMWSAANVPEGSIITKIDGVPVPDLDTLKAELETKGDGQRIRVSLFLVNQPRQPYETVAVMDRRWHPMRHCQFDAASGQWPCAESPPPPRPPRLTPAAALPQKVEGRIARKVAPALVTVEFDIPIPTAGIGSLDFAGAGTVIDAERGLVLVDRDTVPVGLGDMSIQFAGTVRVPGTLVYLHPTHNLAVVSYDPALLGELEVAEVPLAASGPKEDNAVWLVAINSDQEIVSTKARVRKSSHLHMGASHVPLFRDANVQGISLSKSVDSLGGVLVDRRGHMVGLWASFMDPRAEGRSFHGLPVDFIRPVVKPLLEGQTPRYRTLGFEVLPLALATARERGASDARLREVIAKSDEERQVFEILRVHGEAPAKNLLHPNDIILTANGAPVVDARALERLQVERSVTFTVLRNAKEVTVNVPTLSIKGAGVDRVVTWAGLVLHDPHYEVQAQTGLKVEGAYIAWQWFGSPAQRYGVRPTRRIVEVDGVPTPNLDAFLAAVQMKDDREPVRLTLETDDGIPLVQTLKLDLHYWPTQLLELRNGAWIRSRPQTGGSAGG